MKSLEQDIRDTLDAAVGGAAPDGYYESLADTIAGALEEQDMRGGNTNTGPNGAKSGDDLPPDILAGATTASEDDSGLIDIKNMARSTKQRVTQRMSTETDVEESLLASSRPSALRDVVLPEPGKEGPPMSLAAVDVATSTTDPAAAVEASSGAAPSSGGNKLALVAAVVLLGGGVVGWFAFKGGGDADSRASNRSTVAVNGTNVAATPSDPADESPTPAEAGEPGGIAVDDGDKAGDSKVDDSDATGADSEPAASDTGTALDTDKVAEVATDRGAKSEVGKSAGTKTAGKSGGSVARAGKPSSAKTGKTAAPKKVARAEDTRKAAKQPDSKSAKKRKKSAEPDFEDLLDGATGGAHAAKGGAAKAEPEKKTPSKSKLSRGDVKSGMRSVRGRVVACYEQHKVPGTVSVKVKISNTGVVTGAMATGKFKGTATGACVSKAVTAATFREFSGPPMSFTYPFLLQ